MFLSDILNFVWHGYDLLEMVVTTSSGEAPVFY
jgi:hypothetical protein